MTDWKRRCLLTSATLGIVAISVLFYVCNRGWSEFSYVDQISASITFIGCVILSTISVDIWSLGPADSLSFQTLIANYRQIRGILRLGKQLKDEFEATLMNFTKVQEQNLMDILKTGAKTKFGFPIYFGTTSGSTGKHKVFPITEEAFKTFDQYFGIHPLYIILTNIPRHLRLRKIIRIGCYTQSTKIECGLNKGPMSAYFTSHSLLYTIPKEGIYLSNNDASLYINLLFSLREKEISFITTLFAPSAIAFFQRMQTSWKSLCDNIDSGTIQPHPHISKNIHQLLQNQFQSHPKRAEFLRQEFTKGFVGIAKRIWPDIGMVSMISSGPFLAAMEVLASSYTKGLRNYSRAYQAEIGELYEIVVTTPDGLYRYRTTDVIRAAGFHGNTLYFNFVQRIGEVLNLRNEKTPVSVVEACLRSTLHAMLPEATIVDYCCTESLCVDNVTGGLTETRYWVFVEITPPLALPEDFSKMMDDRLVTSLASYRRHRDHATASHVNVVCVKTTTFDRLRDKVLGDRVLTAFDQYKCPRVMRLHDYVKHLVDNVI